MSNEFILIVAWKSLYRNYRWRSISSKLSKIKINCVKLLQEKDSYICSLLDLHLITNKSSEKTFVTYTDNLSPFSILTVNGDKADMYVHEIEKDRLMAVCGFKNLVMLVNPSKIRVVDLNMDFKEVWMTDDIRISDSSFGVGQWSCSSRYCTIVGSRVCIVTETDSSNSTNSAMYMNLKSLTVNPAVMPTPEIIATGISYAILNQSKAKSVYWICDGKISVGHNNDAIVSMANCIDQSKGDTLLLSCLAESGEWLVAAGLRSKSESTPTNEFFLISKKSKTIKDRLSIGCDSNMSEGSKLSMTQAQGIYIVACIRMFRSMAIFAICRGKMTMIDGHVMTDPGNDSSQNYGIVAVWNKKKAVEFYVAGSKAFLNRITVELP